MWKINKQTNKTEHINYRRQRSNKLNLLALLTTNIVWWKCMCRKWWQTSEYSVRPLSEILKEMYISSWLWKNKIQYTHENSIVLMIFLKLRHNIIYVLLLLCTIFIWDELSFPYQKERKGLKMLSDVTKVTQILSSDMSQEISIELSTKYISLLTRSLIICSP